MPPPKTYILPPTFDYPPNSSIRLGNLLTEPFTPHRPLAVLPAESLPDIATTTQTNLTITHTTNRGASLSLSAHLLELAGLKAASEFSLSGSTTYSAATVTTRFCEPDEAAIQNLVMATPRAKRILFPSRGISGRLFVITGIKTAEGFSVSRESGVRRGGTLGADVPLAAAVPGLAVGAEVGGDREKGDEEAYAVEGEVVIAYRVVVVGKRGWRRGGELELVEYRGKGRERMLGDDDANAGDGEEMIEVTEAGSEDIGYEDDDGEVSVKKAVVESEEGEVVVFSMEDELLEG
ncbi:predicted protein [Chaetomium globosum CBS 148.51]|uniref:Uncharacterized protein n=1 Tax=Chaetomium globosum (strain ATCC 6205 / CBS 148.51 / DSM 1962 / NBRC 6347 / NRRL 1970) TaxID=306901 RepID=Q2HC76_CHAGB|nr:uncharacterized protein CHGG_02178 [Chaetomium globosum CBS 148.51]EAQ90243.1 predicted protein [Chaetomium globosum CBS 148.51]